VLPTVVLAAELVPGWFAAAFWVAFLALVAVVARDVRRAGGVRRVLTAVGEAIERHGAETRPDDDGRGVSEDPTPRQR
jgi:hypothetical protein